MLKYVILVQALRPLPHAAKNSEGKLSHNLPTYLFVLSP
jgi:hypothetical protein